MSVQDTSSVENVGALQFGNLWEVRELYYQNATNLYEAFLARHAPELYAGGIAPVGDLVADGPVKVLGPGAARAPVLYGSDLRTVLPVVCGFAGKEVEAHASWKVPLDDFCRALSAVDRAYHPEKCSKALVRRARNGLPRSLAKARTVPPTIVTTTTITTPPPIPTTIPYTPGPDGLCPFVGQPCDSPLYQNDPDPDCVCSDGTAR